jgi:hypothetical protein
MRQGMSLKRRLPILPVDGQWHLTVRLPDFTSMMNLLGLDLMRPSVSFFSNRHFTDNLAHAGFL